MRFLDKFILITLFSLLSGCLSLSETIQEIRVTPGLRTLEKATADLTPRQEYYLGRSISATVLTKSPAVESKPLQQYLNELGQYLALHSSRPETFRGYRFVATTSNVPFALSTPGGFVFISTAMLAMVQNEDELAAVFAHEIAHVALKHAEKNIHSSNRLKLGEQFLSVLASSAPNLALLQSFGKVVADSVNMKFNQGQELEADQQGVHILESAGYSASALLNVIKRIPEDSDLKSSHPSGELRLQKLAEMGQKGRFQPNQKTTARFLREARKF